VLYTIIRGVPSRQPKIWGQTGPVAAKTVSGGGPVDHINRTVTFRANDSQNGYATALLVFCVVVVVVMRLRAAGNGAGPKM